jgi:hypothetical protein
MSILTAPAIGTRITTMNDLFKLEEDTILVDFKGSGVTYHVADNMESGVHVAIFSPYAETPYSIREARFYDNGNPAPIKEKLDMRIVFIPSQVA